MADMSRIEMLWWGLYMGYVQTGTGMDDILLVSWLGWGNWIRGIAIASDAMAFENLTLILDKSFLILACN